MEKKGKESMQAFKDAVSQSFIGNLSNKVQEKCFAKAEERMSEDLMPAPIQEHSMEEETKRTSTKKKQFHGLVNNRPHCSIFLGKKGSGKTTLLLQLLLTPGGYYKTYDKIVIISTTFVHQTRRHGAKYIKRG